MESHRWRYGAAGLVLAIACVAIAARASVPRAPGATSHEPLTEAAIRSHLAFLASDELGGRHSFAASSGIAARYLATGLASMGYEGAVAGDFFQAVPLDSGTVNGAATYLVVRSPAGADTLWIETDYMLESPGEILEHVSRPLVFAGYGISASRLGHDDFAGIDVTDKYVIAVNGRPPDLAEAELGPGEAGNPAMESHRAAGLVVVSSGLLSNYDQYSRGYTGRRVVSTRDPDPTPDYQVVQAGPGLVRVLARLLGISPDSLMSPNGALLEPRALDATIELRTTLADRAMPATYNVVGRLEGADPELRHEHLVLVAHYDAVIGEAGVIYNGANDNASGTAAMLEVAHALASGPRPRRSILVAFVTGEEFGLLGSEWLVDHDPPIPMSDVVAVLDADMIGRSRAPADTGRAYQDLAGPNAVYVMAPESLWPRAREANAAGPELELLDDFGPETFLFQRSDGWSFAQRDVPTLQFFTGFHPEYHQPTDDVETIDFGKLTRIARLAHEIAVGIGNDPDLDELREARRE